MRQLSRLLDNQFKNIEAETAILGSLLSEGDLIKDTWLKAEHFYLNNHQLIFKAIKDLDDKSIPVDIISVITRLNEKNTLTEIGGAEYLNQLCNSTPTTANFDYYSEMVRDTWKMRSAVLAAQKMQRELIDTSDYKAVDMLVDQLQEISQDNLASDFNLQDTLQEIFEDMQVEKKGLTGANMGFTELNRMLDGCIEGDFIIVGARPSIGKTAFALNIGKHVAEEDAVGIFSLEMKDKILLKRMIASTSNVNGMKMRNALSLFDVKDWNKVTNGISSISKLNLKIWDTPGQSFDDIYRDSRAFKKKYRDRKVVIVIDYLQLITGNPKHGGDRTREISEISRKLKNMARELNVCVIALSQLSRNVEQRQDKRPLMSDLRESGQIEQDADTIMFLYRDDYYDKESESKDIIEIIIAKQRNGPVGTVELAFIKEFNKFVDLERRYKENEATG